MSEKVQLERAAPRLCGKPLYVGFNIKVACWLAAGHDGRCAPPLGD